MAGSTSGFGQASVSSTGEQYSRLSSALSVVAGPGDEFSLRRQMVHAPKSGFLAGNNRLKAADNIVIGYAGLGAARTTRNMGWIYSMVLVNPYRPVGCHWRPLTDFSALIDER